MQIASSNSVAQQFVPIPGDVDSQVAGWNHAQFGWLHERDNYYPLFLNVAASARNFTKLDAKNTADAVAAVRELRADGSTYGMENAVLQARDGSYWASTGLTNFWKQTSSWPTGERVSKYRKTTIDSMTLFGTPKVTVQSLHDDLRAIVGDRFVATFGPNSQNVEVVPTKG
jgi:hypothetical protein